MTIQAVVRGCGGYLPEKFLCNTDLESTLETSDVWIQQRTGIKRRHIASEGQYTSHLAIGAARAALESAGVQGSEIDLIIVATTSPDRTFPSTAVKVQAALGTQGCAFDLQAVCSGFIFALATAHNFIRAGQFQKALVIGADTLSRLLDWQDRTTAVLFGDGGGAIVLTAETAEEVAFPRGVLGTLLRSDGQYEGILCTNGGVSSNQQAGVIQMQGREVFRHAVEKLADVALTIMSEHFIVPEQIDWLVPHQANLRIIEGTAKKLGVSMEKVIVTVDQHANTSAASIPLALQAGVNAGKIKPGDLILCEALGAGLTWGGALIRW